MRQWGAAGPALGQRIRPGRAAARNARNIGKLVLHQAKLRYAPPLERSIKLSSKEADMNFVRMLVAACSLVWLAACGQPSGGEDAMDAETAAPAPMEAEPAAPEVMEAEPMQPAMDLMPASDAEAGDASDAMADPAAEPATELEPAMQAEPAMEAEPATPEYE